MTARITIDFTIGSRRLASAARQVSTSAFSLADVLAQNDAAADMPDAPASGPDGVRLLSAPAAHLPAIMARYPGLVPGARQDYPRHYIAMTGSYADYMARFSGKTRSGLRRKARRLAEDAGGYTITEHRNPAEIEEFLQLALPLSARTYQARLLGAGLPDDAPSRRAMLTAAEEGRMRCFLLHAGGAAIAYLALQVEGATVIYAHLGYDPDWARLSPGTVLQMEVLKRLYAEERYRWFDFTEGDGAHKQMFGTHSALCTSLVLLRPTLGNRALLGTRAGFDGLVQTGKRLAENSGALAPIRGLLRA